MYKLKVLLSTMNSIKFNTTCLLLCCTLQHHKYGDVHSLLFEIRPHKSVFKYQQEDLATPE